MDYEQEEKLEMALDATQEQMEKMEERINELEDHLVQDHNCMRPTLIDRVLSERTDSK